MRVLLNYSIRHLPYLFQAISLYFADYPPICWCISRLISYEYTDTVRFVGWIAGGILFGLGTGSAARRRVVFGVRPCRAPTRYVGAAYAGSDLARFGPVPAREHQPPGFWPWPASALAPVPGAQFDGRVDGLCC